jgi:hypothetical protein
MKTLGMQTLFEGMAVGIMQMLRTNSLNPLFIDIIRKAELDESRHAAFGVLSMRRVVETADETSMNEMEDWAFSVLEALNANQQLDMLRLLGPKYDLDPVVVTQMMLALPNWKDINSAVYMHTVVPNLKNLGLITERTESKWREVGMISDNPSIPQDLDLAN